MKILASILLLLPIQYLMPSLAVKHSSPPPGSILEIINTKEVERIIAERKANESRFNNEYNNNDNNNNNNEKRYLLDNEFDENYIAPSAERDFEMEKLKLLDDHHRFHSSGSRSPNLENARVDINTFVHRNNNLTDPYKNTELLNDLRGFKGLKLLKSSKNALFITKKEYLQRDWCKTEPLIQKIKEEGCLTRTLINRFCYGQCNSFYIPKNPHRKRHNYNYNRDNYRFEEPEDEDQNGPAFKACSFCRPKKFTWVTITLRCPSMVPPFRKRRVQRIKQCKCMSIDNVPT